MEFEKQIIKMNQEKGSAFTQITLEDDYIVPDARPDVLKIIHTKGSLLFDEPKVSNQALWINGRMNFTVLYRSEDSTRKLETVSGAIPFQEKLSMDNLEETDDIRIKGSFEDISASLINSRKLAVRAIVNIEAKAECERWEELAAGISEDMQCEQKVSTRELLCLSYTQKDLLRIRRELQLPPAKENISELIYDQISLQHMEVFAEDRGIRVTGEACVCVLYRGQSADDILFYETAMPFEGVTESPGMNTQDVSWIEICPETPELEIREDYDGEQRVLGVELVFAITARVWTEEQLPVLEDVYAPDRELVLRREPMHGERLLIRNQTKVRVADQIQLEKNQEKILQICCSDAEMLIEHVTEKEQGLLVEGMLKVHLLYLTNDEFLPVAYTESYLPVEQLIELPGAQGQLRYELQADMEQFRLNLMDSVSYEIKGTIRLEAIVFEEELLDKVADIEERPLDLEAWKKQPGLIGYKVKEGEALWDIAKAFHTTAEHIQKINHLESANVHLGQKLVVVKEIV